jgi:CHASE3 domain sensor protein
MNAGAPRHPRTLKRQITIAAVLLGLVQAAVFALLIGAVRSADGANLRANQVLAASEAASDLERFVIDAVTGMRGFVITGRREFLEPTLAAQRAIPAPAVLAERVRALISRRGV